MERKEHMELLALYLDGKQSMGKIAILKKRSKSTISEQFKRHNEAIARSGFCPICRRVHGKHETVLTKGKGRVESRKSMLFRKPKRFVSLEM